MRVLGKTDGESRNTGQGRIVEFTYEEWQALANVCGQPGGSYKFPAKMFDKIADLKWFRQSLTDTLAALPVLHEDTP
ncbi:MAG TPA: hypothetical protein VFH73_13625 [Polyangia bacterium]|jgi:hypothetical protein|nr:hypothetical protein [Polyangia bacterium]